MPNLIENYIRLRVRFIVESSAVPSRALGGKFWYLAVAHNRPVARGKLQFSYQSLVYEYAAN